MTLPSICARACKAGACAAALLACACGSSIATVTPSSSTSPSGAGPSARPFAAAGFTTEVPQGWDDETTNQSAVAAISGSGTVLMLLVAPDGGHIDARTAPQPIPDDELATYLESVSQSGATDLSSAEPVDIDGVSGVVITYTLAPAGGPASRDEDMVVNQGGDTYDVVLNTAAAGFTTDQAALQSILDSWKWG